MHNDGSKYTGEWYEDKQHGYGAESWANNTFYEGSYYMGKKHGIGRFVWYLICFIYILWIYL